MERRELVASLVAGGCAGMCVDLTLYPLDTLKTRLQSQQGFHKAGGFRGIYAGVPSAAVGSFPNAAAFFVTYECTKSLLGAGGAGHVAPVTHMLAASLGEVVSLPLAKLLPPFSFGFPSAGSRLKMYISLIPRRSLFVPLPPTLNILKGN
ncbi:S-adenosylmethionine mitochondrial carrier protein [Liparis tanakae]|uniref:Mitochondrial S-adenosylmethionine carrier protein n=1 Tax=Liparis tanakae TaxID=230148 RepID=A0A4Z2EFX7_9TELE|nr:S-adenosylmethionine mitochondrial carrier protein [Liparis tanakae]